MSFSSTERYQHVHSTHDATMTAEQFSTVFQVTKEFNSIPEDVVLESGFPVQSPSEILELARRIRKSLLAGPVDVHFVSPSASDSRTLRISASAGEQGHGAASTGEVPLAAGQLWRPLIDVAVATLGEKELRFRTGFTKDEVASAAAPLDDLFAVQ
ncbi:hypothetical protein SPRI_1944 [Streptomyces pristinaespiralis]|uniref:Uncharacterized protein n=1 Tax=Streptomyces pristinaespiralis TaxID=38300 RepID=A0A0M4DPL4_STRPR|nr:hypothetical protein SPRI_1944 [Streptomyces pristinaespiralis]